MELPLPNEEGLELLELLPVRQLEVVEEVDRLLEGGVRREVADLVADVPQTPGLAVDVGDLRVRGDDLPQPLLAHAARIEGGWARTQTAVPTVRLPARWRPA